MAKRRGLGRGLDALLTTPSPGAAATPSSTADGELREIPIDLIERGRFQPRTHFDQTALEALAESIRSQGVVQPIVVRPTGSGESFELIAGERRWRASQIAGLTKLPAVVREIADEVALPIALIENIQREDLNPMEEARALRRLIDEFSMTHQDAASAVGRSRTAVSNTLRLLELGPEVAAMLEDGSLEMGHARALLALGQLDAAQGAGDRCCRQPAAGERGGSGPQCDPQGDHRQRLVEWPGGLGTFLQRSGSGRGFRSLLAG